MPGSSTFFYFLGNQVLRQRTLFAALAVALSSFASVHGADSAAVEHFRAKIEPILTEKCYDCHAGGMQEGSVAFDGFESSEALVDNPDLWWRALKMVRAGMMPPVEMTPLTAEEKNLLESWIKQSVFQGDPKNPDPGRVTLRRLNRIEYRNTIRDLMGVDYDAQGEFPQDDSGHGFDNIGDVLNMSPLLLEKYLSAARAIVSQGVVLEAKRRPEVVISGQHFQPEGSHPDKIQWGPRWLSYYTPAWVSHRHKVEHAGRYELVVSLSADERYVDTVFDYNTCRFTFSVDGVGKLNQEFTRQNHKSYEFKYEVDWQPGDHELIFELTPLNESPQTRNLTMRIKSVTVRGPLDGNHWVANPGYEKFFPRKVPPGANGRWGYARGILKKFATRAYRRPVDKETLDRLTALAEDFYSKPGNTFEQGIAEAMTAVLASPRFLFREEVTLKAVEGEPYPYLDDYSLASRLSYFLWSTMPDDELMRLAAEGRLRENLPVQFERMFNNPRSQQFIENFVGQWLRARNINAITINAPDVLQADAAPSDKVIATRARFRDLMAKVPQGLTEDEQKELDDIRKNFIDEFRKFSRFKFDGGLRYAMRRETEMFVEAIFREDRPLAELLASDYTFLNEELAKHYGIEGVQGKEMRRVSLPTDSPRGGILTQGTVLTVTSNPDRTSPVKRGLFVLENILGTPPPPPPPNIPSLEAAGEPGQRKSFTIREALAVHREEPLCSSCHNRMDPIGLAMERFNAMGMWRDTDHGKAIDSTGELITGEGFSDITELKQILIANHTQEFYRCLTEKLLTYALGRGVEYYDTETVDAIVAAINEQEGRPSAMLKGVIMSTAFQRCRLPELSDGDSSVAKTASNASP